MAKVTTPQNIPAELLYQYQAALGEVRPDKGVRKRYPFRVPTMRTLDGHPSANQKTQRARFLTVRDAFNDTDWPTRQRWYTAAPVWGSFLWYYNYFIMSGLMDVLGANPEGASVIKTIKHYTFTLPSGAPANVNVVIAEVDPTKVAVFLFGGGHNKQGAGDPTAYWAWNVYPYLVSVAAELVIVKASSAIDGAAGCSITVIEYI